MGLMKNVAAAERGDAPDEALELKVPHDDPNVINVRFAGDPDCSADKEAMRAQLRFSGSTSAFRGPHGPVFDDRAAVIVLVCGV